MARIIALILVLSSAPAALADGGVVAASQVLDGRRVTVFVSPVAPRIGPVDLSVLLHDERGSERATSQTTVGSGAVPASESLEVRVRATHIDDGIERSGVALVAHQGNRLLRSALLDLPREGRWVIEIQTTATEDSSRGSSDPWPEARFELEIGPPLPAWQSQWPWLLAWIPITGVLLTRERLVKSQRRSRRAE